MEYYFISPLDSRKQEYLRLWGDDYHAVEAFPADGMIHDVELLRNLSPIERLSPISQNEDMGTNDPRRYCKQGRKRSINSLESDENVPDKRKQLQRHRRQDINSDDFLYPCTSLPPRESRVINFKIRNAFHNELNPRHPYPRRIIMLKEGETNGYVKFSLNKKSSTLHHDVFPPQSGIVIPNKLQKIKQIPMLPANFGRNMILANPFDLELWKFYYTAFCAGRTLLKKTNLFLVDFAKMADSNSCVMHAVLALAATYVLDYTQGEQWRERANYHYAEATRLLSLALKDKQTHEIGKEDAVVSAIIILTCEDIITWELRRSKYESQRWHEGVCSAIEILDQSNPGFQFNYSVNVQNSAVRTSNANLIASFDIVARPVMRLNSEHTGSDFLWLLNGTPKEQSRIHGGTGVSPKILHILSQITHISVKMAADPGNMIAPITAETLETVLLGVRQWSELSDGFSSEKELLDACDLNEQGLVSTPTEVTDLTAQAWVSAAQIYLQCRFHRRPRSHSAVKAPLKTLLRCIKRMPCAGILFTSQSPFFPIFIMGVVSETDEERDVARHWFETVVEGLGCRSSVPPVWEALQHLWVWIDENSIEDHDDFDGKIRDRRAWWEDMVDMLMDTFGVLSLC